MAEKSVGPTGAQPPDWKPENRTPAELGLQVPAQGDTSVPAYAVKHGAGGQYVAIGDGWLIPADKYDEYAGTQTSSKAEGTK